MDLALALTGNLEEKLRERNRPVARAATLALRESEKVGKQELRAQVRRNFKRTPPDARRLGQNFEKTFQWKTFPRGRKTFSLAAAGVVEASASYVDIFQTGGTVSAKGELVLPLPAAQSAGWGRGTTAAGKTLNRTRKYSQVDDAWDAVGPLFRIPARGGAILAADRDKARAAGLKRLGRARKNRNFVPIFYLTRSVRLPELLDFFEPVERAQRALPELFVKHFDPEE